MIKKIITTVLLIIQLAIYAEEKNNQKLLLPFNAFSYMADFHIIGFPEDHKEIESIEAFVFKRKDSYIFRAVVTGHDKKQKDYVNSKELLEGYNRDAKLVNGHFEISNSINKCILTFNSDKNDNIELTFWGHNPPDEKYGALTDPMGHSPDSGLP